MRIFYKKEFHNRVEWREIFDPYNITYWELIKEFPEDFRIEF